MPTPALGSVVITCAKPPLRVACRMGPTAPVVTGGYGGWQRVARPRRTSLTHWTGRDPFTVQLDLLLDGWLSGLSVEADCRAIEAMATPQSAYADPPPIRVSGSYPHADLVWVVDGVTWGDSLRLPSGDRARQQITLVLLEFIAEDRVKTVAAQTRDKTSSKAKQRTTTVHQGDTLQTIAARQLGSYKRWNEIAKLNGIRDPNWVLPGEVLKLP